MGLFGLLIATPVVHAGQLSGSNGSDITIPDNDTGGVSSRIDLSGAPTGAKITSVEYYVRIKDVRVSDIVLGLYSPDSSVELIWDQRTGGSTDGGNDDDIANDDNIDLNWREKNSEFDGESPNGTWRLVAFDLNAGIQGSIDFFEIKVNYEKLLPDLTKSFSSLNKSTVYPGETLDLSVTVQNIGEGSANSGYVYYYWKKDSRSHTSSYKEGSGSYGALGPNGTSSGSFSYTVPANATPGTYYLYYWIDATGTSAESDEGNNKHYWTITVQEPLKPDLVLTTPTSINPTDSTLYPGYSFYFWIDATDTSDETEEEMHQKIYQIMTVQEPPSVSWLTVYDFWRKDGSLYADPNSSLSNPNFDAQYKVRNDGNSAITIQQLALAVHDSNGNHLFDLATTGSQVPRYYYDVSLNPGDSHHFSFSVGFLPDSGSYQLIAKAKLGGSWQDIDTQTFAMRPYSELVNHLTSFDFWIKPGTLYADPNSSFSNPNFDAQYKINNGANQSITIDQLVLAVHRSDGTWLYHLADSSGNPREYNNVQLDANQSKQFDRSFGYFREAGSYKVIAKADINGGWKDLDTKTFTVQESLLPDLLDDGETHRSFDPRTLSAGVPFSIQCGIRNRGNVASGDFVVKFYAANTFNDYYIGQKNMSSISADTPANCDWSGSFPANIPTGIYTVKWVIDANNQVSESEEDNNTAWKEGYELTVEEPPQPDLTVGYPVTFFPSSVTAGGTVQVSWTEKNNGSAASGSYYTKIYLASEAYSWNYEIGSYYRSTLGAESQENRSLNCTVPTSVPDGAYYVTAYIDRNNSVSESNELNNVGSSTPNKVTVEQPQISPPSWVSASDGSHTDKVRVTWNSVNEASHYHLYRAISSGGLKTSLGSWQSSTTFEDTTATPGQTHYYFVKAATSGSGANASDYSGYDTGWRKLSPPTGVSATDGQYTDRVKVIWNEVTGASCYQVYCSGSLIRSWDSSRTFDDFSAIPDQPYSYSVKAAVDCNGNRPSSESTSDEGWRKEEISSSPSISSVSPNPITADIDNKAQILTINGSGFVEKPSITLTWTGEPSYPLEAKYVTFISSSKLEMALRLDRGADTWTVKVTNPDGASSNVEEFQVLNPPPVAVPSCNHNAPTYGQSVSFNGEGSKVASGLSIDSYSWNFGDQTTATGPSPIHTFSNANALRTYSVTLTVTDSAGVPSEPVSMTVNLTGLASGSGGEQSLSPDPVNLATGNFIYDHTDLTLPGIGFPFMFQRFYNSKDTLNVNGSMGAYWSHSYNVRVDSGDGVAYVKFGDGRTEMYVTNSVGAYVFAEAGIHNTLMTNALGNFILTTKEQTHYNFNALGRLASIVDKNSNTLSLAYDGSGDLVAITNSAGRVVTFVNDANHRIAQMIDPLNRTNRFAYSAQGDLISATDPRGGVTHYGYDGEHQMTYAVDPNGNQFVRNVYNNNRVVESQKDALGNTTAFIYDFVIRETIVTNALGYRQIHKHDDWLRIVEIIDEAGNVQNFEYDEFNNRTNVVDKNRRTTHYTYDGKGNVTSKTDPLGNVTTVQYDPKNNPTNRIDTQNNETTFRYDGNGNLTQTVNPLGFTNTITYDPRGLPLSIQDANGNTLSNRYDSVGNLVSTRDALGFTNVYLYDAAGRTVLEVDPNHATNRVTYDGNNNLIQSVDPLGFTNLFVYDANDNQTLMEDSRGYQTTKTYDVKDRLVSVSNALGGIISNVYDALDRKILTVDPLGSVTHFAYDLVGNLTAVTNALGQVTRHTYDPNGNQLTAVNPLGQTTTNEYDELNRLIAVIDPLGHTTRHTYDALGRKSVVLDSLTNTTRFTYDPVGNLTSVTNALGQVTRYTYDPNGNQLTSINALGRVTINEYDALNRLVAVADPVGNITRYAYDALGRRTQITDAEMQITQFQYDLIGQLTNVIDATSGIVSFIYDTVGNRTAMTEPNGNTTIYVYDAASRLVEKREPIGTYQYRYDGEGNRIGFTDANGQSITNTYDANHRLTTVKYPDGSQVTLDYDVLGNRIRMIDSLGTTTYGYDAQRRMTNCTDSAGNTVGYGYDANGNRVSITYPGNNAVHYTFDALNRMKTVQDWLGGVTTNTYDAVGSLAQVRHPNATTATYDFDDAGRLTSLTNTKPNASIISAYTLTLDGVGNHLQTAQMDPIEPLIPAQTVNYAYDNNNQLTNATGAAFTYDGNGNMIVKGADTFVYDHENRLTQAVVGGITHQYQYDGLGNRLSATHGGMTTRYILDVNGPLAHVLAEADASGTITAYYVYGRGLVSRITPSGVRSCYHFDVRGSAVALTDSGGNITDQYAYDPFGVVANSEGSTANPFKYVGRYGIVDEGNGLAYIRARYYSPELGRFVTKDPVTGTDGDSQSLNRYIYALNNPFRYFDISGFSSRETSGEEGRSTRDEVIDYFNQFIKDNPGEAIPLSKEDFYIILKYNEERVTDIRDFTFVGINNADTIFGGHKENRFGAYTFEIGFGSFEIGFGSYGINKGDLYSGGDINYFYQGFVNARNRLGDRVLYKKISTWNKGQAFLTGGDGVKQLKQIERAYKWAEVGKSYYQNRYNTTDFYDFFVPFVLQAY